MLHYGCNSDLGENGKLEGETVSCKLRWKMLNWLIYYFPQPFHFFIDDEHTWALWSELFFFAVNDERLGEGRKFLAGQKGQTADEIREKFEEQRPKLANILKKKMRSKAKKQELMSFSGGRSRSGKLGARKKARLSGKRQSGKASSATNKDKSESTNN